MRVGTSTGAINGRMGGRVLFVVDGSRVRHSSPMVLSDTSAESPRKASWAVLVSSCDASSDLWPVFFHFLFHYWTDVPVPVYLETNYKTYDDPRVRCIRVGDDLSWSDSLARTLDQMPCDYVFLLLEDFLLKQPLQTAEVERRVGELHAVGGRYLETGICGDTGPAVEGTTLRRLVPEIPKAGVNSGIHHRPFLRSLLEPGLSPWKVHSKLRQMNREDAPGLYYSTTEAGPLIRYVESVRGRFWKTEAMEHLRAHGITPDLSWRPYPPQGQDVWSKLVRSYHKRRMRLRNRRDERRQREQGGDVVRPLEMDRPAS